MSDDSELDLVQQLARRLRRTAVDAGRWGLSPHQARALEAVARRELRVEAARSHESASDVEEAPTGVRVSEPASVADEAPTAVRMSEPASVADEAPSGVRISELASRLQIVPRSATEVADALEERGLVQRTPDPTDRRAVLLTVTPEGRDVAREIRAERRIVANRLMESLSAPERAELRRLLTTLLTALDA